ncbi:MAG: bifunctional glutamate N-acetyltransferase/amino-acid acetyltransferase ArgJ, partial [Actinomycetes bacterium]
MTGTLATTPSGVTAAEGFRASGVAAGLKTAGLLDLALVINDGPSRSAAGVFTTNRVKAAPVLWTQQVVRDGRVDAVVLNSGGANACTGAEGFQDTHATAEFAAMALSVSAGDVAICSTGLIGERLPMNALLAGVDAAGPLLCATGGDDAARAIMTTDSVPKQSVAVADGFIVGGMAKGAGMLAPGLATMLSVLTTDADADAETLDRVLREATSRTFERVDSDGCMSTNDTVLLLASGASGRTPTEEELARAVHEVCADLARQLVDDAEGASKTIAVQVVRAASEEEAVTVGRAVARSNLLKCAIHGEDPNWGRVLAAVGTTDATFEPQRLAVSLGGVWVCRDGAAAEDRSKADLSGRLVTIVVDLAA